MTDKPVLILGRKALAKFMGLSESYIDKLVDRGHIERLARGKYDVSACVQGYVKYRSEEDKLGSKSKAMATLQTARAEKLEIEVRVMKRELVPMDEAMSWLDGVCGAVRSEFSGLATRFTRDLELRKRVDVSVAEALNRISEKYEKIVSKINKGEIGQ